jgi:hypothetical protein
MVLIFLFFPWFSLVLSNELMMEKNINKYTNSTLSMAMEPENKPITKIQKQSVKNNEFITGNFNKILWGYQTYDFKKDIQKQSFRLNKLLNVFIGIFIVFNGLAIGFFPYGLEWFLKSFFPYLTIALNNKIKEEPEKYEEYKTVIDAVFNTVKSQEGQPEDGLLNKLMAKFCYFLVFNLRSVVNAVDNVFDFSKGWFVFKVIIDFFFIAHQTFFVLFLLAMLTVNFLLVLAIVKTNKTLRLLKDQYFNNKIKITVSEDKNNKYNLKRFNRFIKNLILTHKNTVYSNNQLIAMVLGFCSVFYISFLFFNPNLQSIVDNYMDIITKTQNSPKKIKDLHLINNYGDFWDPYFLVTMIIFFGMFFLNFKYQNLMFLQTMAKDKTIG